jgi:EAL domain-containing protein (putative c-di-GMP-specific phosphodiesterase class I)
LNIPDDHVDQAIVRAVTDLAHSMHLTVVAEGVETTEQAQILRELNVDLLQVFSMRVQCLQNNWKPC